VRAFAAIGLPEEAQSSLAHLQGELARAGADVKWVEPQHLHLTLKFLGELSAEERQAVETAMARVAARHPAFTAALGAVGAFPSVGSPRVVWVGLAEGAEQAASLAAALEREGTAIPLRREERAFSPHLTLGRVRSPRNRGALSERLRSVAWHAPAPWHVSSLRLYESVLSPAGPRYTVLLDARLSGK